MKRSNQNNFMPFTVGGNSMFNQFTNKRKKSLVAAFSDSNRTIEDIHFDQLNSTQEDDPQSYTSYDLDVENAGFMSETQSNTKFIFDATVVDRNDCMNQEHILNEETPIISMHWAEISDHDLLIEQKPKEGKEPVVMDNTLTDDNKDLKPYLWFI